MSDPQPLPVPSIEVPAKYAKTIIAILTAVIGVVISALTDSIITRVEIVNIAIALVTAIGVYAIPNIHDQTVGKYAKVLIAFLGAGLQALPPLVVGNGHITNANWLMVLLAALGALGVGVVPNVNPDLVQTAKANAYANAVTAAAGQPAQVAAAPADPVVDPGV